MGFDENNNGDMKEINFTMPETPDQPQDTQAVAEEVQSAIEQNIAETEQDLGATQPIQQPYVSYYQPAGHGGQRAGGYQNADGSYSYRYNSAGQGGYSAGGQYTQNVASSYATPKAAPKKKKKIFWPVFAILMALIAIGAGILVVYEYMEIKNYRAVAENNAAIVQEAEAPDDLGESIVAEVPEMDEDLDEVDEFLENNYNTGMDVVAVTEGCMPSIVSITTKGIQEVEDYFSWFYGGGGKIQQEFTAAGSGVIIGENDEEILIVTNNHVVKDANTLTVSFIDDEAVEAKLKGTDSTVDVAVIAVKISDLKPSTKSAIKVATIGNSNDLKVGESVVAIGNALGYGQSVTTGIVSALHRNLDDATLTEDLIQTDAAINPGNSGGALLNSKGQLIGINVAKEAQSYVEAMGYAIPISDVEPIINELMNRETKEAVPEGEQGYLGIYCQEVTSQYAQMYNVPVGIYVTETIAGGGAEKAGLQAGDIITALNGIGTTTSDALTDELSYYRAGETVTVTIERMAGNGEYESQDIAVTLSKDLSDD